MYALFIFAQCGLPVALVLLIIGLCLRRRSVWICAPIVFVCSFVLMFSAALIDNVGRAGLRRDEDLAEIEEIGSDYFVADGTRYESMGLKNIFIIHEYSPREYYHLEGENEYSFSLLPNSDNYYILIDNMGELYCRATEKEAIIAALTDPDNIVWYGCREYAITRQLDTSLVDEVLTFCESAEGTEDIPREDCRNIILTKTSGGVIERENFSLLLYGGLVYYAPTENGPVAQLPADLSIRLLTALDD